MNTRCASASYMFFIVVCLAFSSCRLNHREWTEDVVLDDGSTIVVERSITIEETSSWGGDATNSVETDARIKFTGALSNLPEWREPLMALVLYRDSTTDEWVVVASTTDCDTWMGRGKPKPSYWEFRLRNNAWQEVALSASSIGRRSNLLFNNRRLTLKHVTAAERSKLHARPTIGRKYREIWGDPNMYTCGEGDTNK